MTYRKFKADYLFTGREMAEKDAVLITTEDGTVQAILPAAEAGEGIEQLRGALSPGFINCHCHLELSHLKGVLPERTGMVDFLLAVMQQRGASPEFIGASIDDAEESMLHNGIVRTHIRRYGMQEASYNSLVEKRTEGGEGLFSSRIE